MTKVSDVEEYIENELAPLDYSLPSDRNGVIFGTLDKEVTGIVVCWSPTLRVIQKAVEKKANLIIAHEWLIYEYSRNKWIEKEKDTFAKLPNIKRLELLTKYNISVLKHHSNWDFAPGGIADSFGEYLCFNNLIKKGRVIRVYKEKQQKIGKLARNIAKKLGLSHVVVSGDLKKEIKYIGTAVGGLGQIFTLADDFADTKTEIIIFGEILEYTVIYLDELGYAHIVTGHEASEKPGMIKLSRLLKRRFPEVNVQYCDSSIQYNLCRS